MIINYCKFDLEFYYHSLCFYPTASSQGFDYITRKASILLISATCRRQQVPCTRNVWKLIFETSLFIGLCIILDIFSYISKMLNVIIARITVHIQMYNQSSYIIHYFCIYILYLQKFLFIEIGIQDNIGQSIGNFFYIFVRNSP